MEVVKQEMARVNVHILGISELKWTGMGEFNSGHSKHPLYIRDYSTHGHREMVNTQHRLIIFFAAKDGLFIQSAKQDWELTVAQIMNSLLPNSDLN